MYTSKLISPRFLLEHRKIRLERPVSWDHHKGGWKDVVNQLQEHLHCDDGVRILTAIEETIMSGEVINEPWVGFLHEAPIHSRNFPDLERLVQIDTWKASIRKCKGIWVLCSYYKEFLKNELKISCPVNVVYYPTAVPDVQFSFSDFEKNPHKKVLFIGEYLRIFESFYNLVAPTYEKILLGVFPFDKSEIPEDRLDSVTELDYVSGDTYEQLLKDSIVFLHLSDAGANTTIIEAIARFTPILVNKVGGVEEYLGPNYPFYFKTLEEASQKLQDLDLIASTVVYLKRWHVRHLIKFDYFIQAIQNTAIYRNLPVPRSQQSEFRSFDLTVMIISYKRVDDLKLILRQFELQSYSDNFEVLVWNNNIELMSEVQAIYENFKDRLNLRIIHSSENFYCIARLAMPYLIRSEILLTCDDDVIPSENFIATFLEKFNLYGPDAVLCSRGHVFSKHSLDEEHPERIWAENTNLQFFDENDDDKKVHFMHADTCLIPKHILHQISQYILNKYEYRLIDDYWLSFIISHKLNLPIWKINASNCYVNSSSAEDPDIALYLNDKVNEQRINFYIEHMSEDWP